MSKSFVLYSRKMIRNPLLGRKQMAIEMIHPEEANISKTLIKEKLAALYKSKSEWIAVFGLHTKFGGGRSSGFALIYDSLEARKKYDQKKFQLRDGCFGKEKGKTRKQLKEIKGREKKARGKAKIMARTASKKKK